MSIMNYKSYGITVISLVAFVTGPLLAYAVSVDQDVTLETSNGGDDMTMLAGSAFDTLTINGNSFTFTLSGSQSVTLRDDGKHIMKSNVDGVNSSCGSGNSEIQFSASDAASIIIDLEEFACSGGGSGGGSYTSSSGGSTTSSTDTTTTTTEPAETATETTTTTEESPYLEGAPPPALPLPPVSAPAVPAPTPAFSAVLQISRGLTVGSTGNDVTALQEALASMPDIYPEGIVSGYFGSLTKAAVERFQMKYGVVSSVSDPGYGYVGPVTRAKLAEVFGGTAPAVPGTPVPSAAALASVLSRELDEGDEGTDVTQVQAFLAADPALYPEGLVTGYYGPLTTAAVRRFQAKYGISQVGRVGPQTLARLNELMGTTAASSGTVGASSGTAAEREALQNQINDLQTLLDSLLQQMQAAQ